MKGSNYHKQVNYFLSAHRRSGLLVSVFYPKKSFPGISVSGLRTFWNRTTYDCKAKYLPEHEALIIYDYPEVLND